MSHLHCQLTILGGDFWALILFHDPKLMALPQKSGSRVASWQWQMFSVHYQLTTLWMYFIEKVIHKKQSLTQWPKSPILSFLLLKIPTPCQKRLRGRQVGNGKSVNLEHPSSFYSSASSMARTWFIVGGAVFVEIHSSKSSFVAHSWIYSV